MGKFAAHPHPIFWGSPPPGETSTSLFASRGLPAQHARLTKYKLSLQIESVSKRSVNSPEDFKISNVKMPTSLGNNCRNSIKEVAKLKEGCIHGYKMAVFARCLSLVRDITHADMLDLLLTKIDRKSKSIIPRYNLHMLQGCRLCIKYIKLTDTAEWPSYVFLTRNHHTGFSSPL